MKLQVFFEKNKKILNEKDKLKIYNNFLLRKNKNHLY
jgi:hypothetical protein